MKNFAGGGRYLVAVLTMSIMALVGGSMPASASAAVVPPGCWHDGNFKAGSHIVPADWGLGDPNDPTPGTDECFGIAPNGAIYHDWKASGGWKEMPHGGRADDVQYAGYINGDRSVRVVVIYVKANRSQYCAEFPLGGSWGAWYVCEVS